MIFHRLGLIHKNQKGITLVELLMALLVTAIVTGGITMAIFQVFTGNARSSNHMIAVKQVQNAGYWLSHDGQMAQSIDTNDDTGTPETEVVTLAWVGRERYDADGNQYIDTYEVRYTYDGDSNKLWRHEKITTDKYDANGQLVETTQSETSTPVADYITPIPTATMAGNKLTVTITALVGENEEERTYEITPRPSP